MQVTEHIHALKIPFKIPVSPEKLIDRFVYAYLVIGDEITLIDSGVSGAESIIFEYIKKNGRNPKEICTLILSHAHPDHLGAAKAIKEKTGCIVSAHANEKHWIENTEKQFNDRPVPGFHTLVGGSVGVDRQLTEGDILAFQKGIKCQVLHTPGHSTGSISLLFENDKTIITADAIPLPGDLPIYEDIVTCIDSIKRLYSLEGMETLLSSWEPPVQGQEKIKKRMEEGVFYLQRIHRGVLEAKNLSQDMMKMCKQVAGTLGLPPIAVNPLVAKAFASSLAADKNLNFSLAEGSNR
jgi:glyoxylase-like metal-dependent hydrolase (beta-lactamase superfamily II)